VSQDEKCECGAERQAAADPTMRQRYGHLLHSPFCPIGKRERAEQEERATAWQRQR